jgi:hypothetical protein
MIGMRFDRESWTEWFVAFVPCFVVFNLLSEVGLSFVPRSHHAEVGLSWIISGVGMMLWGYFGDFGDV